MKRTFWLFVCLLPLLALCILSRQCRMHPSASFHGTSQAHVNSSSGTHLHGVVKPVNKHIVNKHLAKFQGRGKFFMSTHLVPGGAAVTIAHDGSSIPNSPSANSYAIYSPGFTGASSPTYSGSIPSVGSPITLGHFTLSNTGSVETVGSQTFALLSLAADSTTANAAGYSLGVGPNTGAGYRAGAFDVGDTTAPVRNTLSFSGATGTLTWTEAGSQPVVQIASGTIHVNGSQDTAANTDYSPLGISPSGFTYYCNNAGWYVYFNGTWRITLYGTSNTATWSQISTGQPYYANPSTDGNTVPSSGWQLQGVVNHTPPTSVTGALFAAGSNQGLTITGLSGGTVTISAVSTTSTTTTFTTSRTIASTETGGTLYGAAGAFSDSAATPNTTAAFSIPITSGMFGGGGGSARRRTAQWQ